MLIWIAGIVTMFGSLRLIKSLQFHGYMKNGLKTMRTLPRQRGANKIGTKRKKTPEEESWVPVNEPGWITIQIGSDNVARDVEMERRISEAKEWESSMVSKKETSKINKLEAIEDELLEHDEAKMPKKGQRKSLLNSPRTSKEDLNSKIKRLIQDDVEPVLKEIKGYLEMNPYICSGCGSSFQAKAENNPGYLPPDKFKSQRERADFTREKQEAIRILQMADVDMNSKAALELLTEAKVKPKVIVGIVQFAKKMSALEEREVPKAVSSSVSTPKPYSKLPNIDFSGLINDINMENNAESIISALQSRPRTATRPVAADPTTLPPLLRTRGKGKNEDELEKVTAVFQNKQDADAAQIDEENEFCICQRCFRLQQYGQVEASLRPGWSENELLTPQRFETLLSSIAKSETVVLCLVDIFDVQGSVVKNLKQIAGPNPIVIGVNKVDLLPKDISQERVASWIHSEVKRICGFVSPRDPQARVEKEYRPWKKDEKPEVLQNVLKRSNVHLISCANDFGLTTIMKDVLELARDHDNKVHVMGAANVGKSSFINRLLGGKQQQPGSKPNSKKQPLVTVSNLPGTTLDFLRIKLPNGITVVDTPGLINPGHLTSKLTTQELKQVIPSKPVHAVTFRVEEGKCVLMGGLARIELCESRPFFFTFYISNEIKLHVTDVTKADGFLETHIGKLIFPPMTAERVQEIGPFVETAFEIEGESWLKAAADIVIPGLGWVTVTGPGIAKIKVLAPEGTEITIRPPLLPFEAKHTTAKFTGGKISKKSTKSGAKSYGWRA